MANWSNTVNCAEEHDSVTENYDDERGLMSASVTLRCAWADRHNLVTDICGNRRAWIKGSAGQAPVAGSAAIKPAGSIGSPGFSQQEIVYAEALVTINFSTKVVDVFSESLEPTAEFVQLPYQLFRWGSGTGALLQEQEAPGKLIRGLNIVRNEYNLTSLDPDLIALVGSVNDESYSSSLLGLSFDAETLLYNPPNVQYKKDSTGVVKYDVTKRFTINPNGWNKYFRGFSGNYQRIYLAGSSDPYESYPVVDLSGLLD